MLAYFHRHYRSSNGIGHINTRTKLNWMATGLLPVQLANQGSEIHPRLTVRTSHLKSVLRALSRGFLRRVADEGSLPRILKAGQSESRGMASKCI
jgi:hypothetical protein